MLQYELATSPVFLNFQSGVLFYATLIPTFQRLDESFQPVGLAELEVPEGKYHYLRYRLYYGSDQSKKLAYSLTYEDGKYYQGNLQSWTGMLRFSPLPQVSPYPKLRAEKRTSAAIPRGWFACNARRLKNCIGNYEKRK